MPSSLAPLERSSAVDLAANDLRRAILEGEFDIGQRLPAERSLSETFGVHRATLRCALARLEAEGLVRARHGSGYMVLDFLRTGSTSLLGPLLALPTTAAEKRSTAKDLLLLRRHLARALFEKILETTDPDFSKVIDAVGALEAAVDAPVEVFAQRDLEVAAALVDVTNSPVLSLCLHPISSVLLSWPALMQAMFRNPASNVDRWRLVIGWLQMGAPVSADELVPAIAEFDAGTIEALEAHIRPPRDVIEDDSARTR